MAGDMGNPRVGRAFLAVCDPVLARLPYRVITIQEQHHDGRIFLLGERCTVPTDGSVITTKGIAQPRSLSDLGGIGCENGKLAHVSRKFSLNSSLLGLEFEGKWPQFPTFSLRFPKSDRLLVVRST